MINASKRALTIEYAIRDIVIPARKLEAEGHNILKLNIGDPNAYDFDTPEFIKQAMCDAVHQRLNGYSASEGHPRLLEAIIKKEKEKYDVNLDKNKILVGSGVSEVLLFLFGAMLEPGDEVLMPGPCYPPYIAFSKFFGANPVAFKTSLENDWQPDIDDIRRKITDKTKALVVISPNNPTGSMYSEKTLRQMVDLAGEHNLPIISDEIYDRITYDRPHISTLSLSDDVPMILFNGLSKVYMAPGWRLGYMCFRDNNDELAEILDGCNRLARIRLCSNVPAQIATAAALEGPEDHLKGNLEKLKERRDYIFKRMNEIDGIEMAKPAGAFYAFPKLTTNVWKNDKEFVLDVLKSIHVLFVFGSGFHPEYGKDHFRLVFLPPVPVLEQACNRLEEFMQSRMV